MSMPTRRARRSAARSGAATLVLGTVLALAACSADDDPAASGRSGATATPDATASTAAPGASDAGQALPTPPPHPTDDAASDQAALEVGTAAVTAFARPDLPAEQWWAELAPLLSPAATEAYVGTDPAEVPAHAVTGPAWSGESESTFLALTFVPTDAGDYAVLMVRDGGGAPWLVERISLVPADATDAADPTDAATPTAGTEEQGP
jgi:hypothetical protein